MRDKSKPDTQHNEWDGALSPPRSPVGVFGDYERRRIAVSIAVYVAGIIIVVVSGLLAWSELTKNSMTAHDPLLSETMHGARRLDDVALGAPEMVYFHVTLNGAPLGRRLDMRCEWLDPGDKIAEVVEYTTARIDKSIWPTHCRHRFTADSSNGRWTVSISVGKRDLASLTFNVERRFGG